MTTTTAQATKISHDGDVKFAAGGSMENCVQCGRKVGAQAKWVAIYDGGYVWAQSQGEPVHDGGWMGMFPVGSECAKAFATGVLYEPLDNTNHDAPHKTGAAA